MQGAWEGDSMTDTDTTQTEAVKHYDIVVNGQKKEIKTDQINFNEVVELAGDLPPGDPNAIQMYDVTYRKAVAPRPEGTMTEGDVVTVKDGTIFNVIPTTKS
jgi:hypothetical protein